MGLPTSALRATPARTLTQLGSAIRVIRPLDGDARAIFTTYGWTVTGVMDASEFDLPALSEFANAAREIRGAAPALMGALGRYATLSADIGLDLRQAAGRHVELLSFVLERTPLEAFSEGAPHGHVIIFERRIVGAWVAVFPAYATFSVRDRAAALAGPHTRASFPPVNRFPSGANVARSYSLAQATSLAYKTGAGGNGTITDAARVRALASALDATLPTTQAVWDQSGTPTTYYLHFDFGTSSVSLQYEAKDNVLTVLADGYSVRPAPDFAALIAALP
jgi:hypothetical protein